MNYIDMFILVLLIYAVYKGYTRGLIMQLTMIVALIACTFLALKLAGFTAHHLQGWLNMNGETLFIASVIITFILIFFAINLMGKLFEKMVEAVQLSLANRLLGVVLSVFKVIIITGVILLLVNRIDNQIRILPKYSQEHSIFYKPFTGIAGFIFPSLKSPSSENHINIKGV